MLATIGGVKKGVFDWSEKKRANFGVVGLAKYFFIVFCLVFFSK